MTRFARAKGSKSSNERAPEDSTPWELMKDQLLQAKKNSDETKNRQEAEKQRIENYENFLKERKVQKRQATWCDFPDSGGTATDVNKIQNELPLKKKKKNKQNTSNVSDTSMAVNSNGTAENIIVNNHLEGSNLKQKKNKKSLIEAGTNDMQTDEATSVVLEAEKSGKKKKKKRKQKSSNMIDNTVDHNGSDNPQGQDINAVAENDTSKANKQQPKGKSDNAQKQVINTAAGNDNSKANEQQPKGKKKKNINGKPVRRKEINDHSFQLIINGKEVELIRFDGFPVMKKDAERLQELKTSMIKKGIPKSEVQRTMKLERRRAEKALARVKRDVCYNCRKGGHVLSDCPELKSKIPNVDTAEGVCFKCGSTEHRQFECKVQRDKEFRFATCFICKEAGHIARQCPDNPKGLYPNGGSCKLCGDVTHLRKDCPTVNDKREGSNIKLQTLDATENLEDVEHQTKAVPQQVNKKPKKITF